MKRAVLLKSSFTITICLGGGCHLKVNFKLKFKIS